MRLLNGWRVPLLAAVVALVALAVGGIVLADTHAGVIVALVAPTVVALLAVVRGERTGHQVNELHAELTEEERRE